MFHSLRLNFEVYRMPLLTIQTAQQQQQQTLLGHFDVKLIQVNVRNTAHGEQWELNLNHIVQSKTSKKTWLI